MQRCWVRLDLAGLYDDHDQDIICVHLVHGCVRQTSYIDVADGLSVESP